VGTTKSSSLFIDLLLQSPELSINLLLLDLLYLDLSIVGLQAKKHTQLETNHKLKIAFDAQTSFCSARRASCCATCAFSSDATDRVAIVNCSCICSLSFFTFSICILSAPTKTMSSFPHRDRPKHHNNKPLLSNRALRLFTVRLSITFHHAEFFLKLGIFDLNYKSTHRSTPLTFHKQDRCRIFERHTIGWRRGRHC
jgi:hypothetical protein